MSRQSPKFGLKRGERTTAPLSCLSATAAFVQISLLLRLTGSGRECEFAAAPGSCLSTRGPSPAKVSFQRQRPNHAAGQEELLVTGPEFDKKQPLERAPCSSV